VKSASGETFAGRLEALRRSAAATRREQRRIRQKAGKDQKSVSSQRLRMARYLPIWTGLPAAHAASDITGYYRCRWREVEFVYHELSAAVTPHRRLGATFANWSRIVSDLSESKRKRARYAPLLG
jgi:hypothetical protein